MANYYIISINSLVDTFSRVEAGKGFDFTIKTSEMELSESQIAVNDVLIATVSDKVYYKFKVAEITDNHLRLHKVFEIEKSIGYQLEQEGYIYNINESEYNAICSKLFKSFNIDDENDNTSATDEHEKISAKVIYAYLKENKSHRDIEKDILNVQNNGYAAMNILHSFEIEGDKKNALNTGSFSEEYRSAKGKYLTGLNLLLKYYPLEFGVKQIELKIKSFQDDCKNSGLIYSNNLISRFVGSLLTKPFVILTGLSGSGKTKLAQAFVQWICQSKTQYKIIPVGADWTNREPLLGYPNALKPEEYIKPDSGALDLILEAAANPDLPHFMILDEMNLSHVERYFADFLSVMESNDSIPLYPEGNTTDDIPSNISFPSNLFIIGTVNIDETTNMFSPKVLDRANTIEFRINEPEMKDYLETAHELNMDKLISNGANMAVDFIILSRNKSFVANDKEQINDTLLKFFSELKKTGAEYGYRTASEIMRLINQIDALDSSLSISDKIDIAIMHKLLPKLHGSRRKLSPILETLATFCVQNQVDVVKDIFGNDKYDFNNPDVLYSLSLEKITRMYKGAIDNGFASFAEA